MRFEECLQTLLDEGVVRISTSKPPADDQLQAAESVLAAFEQRYRLNLPGKPPEISLPPAIWAAQTFYRACQCAAFREIGSEEIKQMLVPYTGKRDAATHYSVDLTFRLLPDLVRRSGAMCRDDPLVAELLTMARAWPLSSVGLEVDARDLEPILQDECLFRLYVDRIMDKKDVSRLNDPRVRERVRAAIGLHEELAPEIVAAVHKLDQQVDSE